MYKYQHQQSTFRGGETGDWISEQRGISPFYNTVDLASNCNVNIAGSISRRHGFSFVTKAPASNIYGDFDVRHDFETETRAKIDKLEESDELVEALHGLKNSQMRNRNDNKKTDVDGSKKRTIDGRNNSNHNLTILIIVGVIFFMMFILPFLVFMSVLLASY